MPLQVTQRSSIDGSETNRPLSRGFERAKLADAVVAAGVQKGRKPGGSGTPRFGTICLLSAKPNLGPSVHLKQEATIV